MPRKGAPNSGSAPSTDRALAQAAIDAANAAATAVNAFLAAQKAVKKSGVDQLVKIVKNLSDVGFPQWDKNLKVVQHSEQWSDSHFTARPAGVTFSIPAAETAAEALERRTVYTVIHTTTEKEYGYLLEPITMGDAVGAYFAIRDTFQAKTTFGYLEASRKLTASNMYADHVTVAEFASLIIHRARVFKEAGGMVDDAMKISILLSGLLTPEFDVKKTHIASTHLSQLNFEAVSKDLVDFAIAMKIDKAKHGGGGRGKVFSVQSSTNSGASTSEKQPCRLWAKSGSCRFGNSCKFSHSSSQNPSAKKTICEHCGKTGHRAAQCYKKRRGTIKDKKKEAAKLAQKDSAREGQLQKGREKMQEMVKQARDRASMPPPPPKTFLSSSSSSSSDSVSEARPFLFSLGRGDPNEKDTPIAFSFMMNHNNSVNHSQVMNHQNDQISPQNVHVSPQFYFVESDRTQWISDGGSNCFVTNDINDFIINSVVEKDVSVGVGSGTVHCKHVGDVLLLDVETGQTFLFQGVHLLPNCGKKLVSEARLDLRGCRVTKEDGVCSVVVKFDQSLVMTATLGPELLYVFDNLVVVSNLNENQLIEKVQVHFTTNNKNVKKQAFPAMGPQSTHAMHLLLTEHRMRGHCDFAICRKILGLKASNDNPHCPECVLAGMTIKSFPDVSSKPKATRPVERWHADIGFGRNSTIIWLIVLDEFTDRIYTSELTGKDKALDKLITLKRQEEVRLYPLRLAYFRSDEDTVFRTSATAKNFFESEGVVVEENGPYRKESKIERTARTVGRRARASLLWKCSGYGHFPCS